MEHVLYERPREKLRSRGVAYLSLSEIIQLIIGSGTAKISAARLAKKVASHIERESLSYESLILIAGLGDAKVCQLLAAVELGKRLAMQTAHSSSSFSNQSLSTYVHEARLSRGAALCIWFDGSNREIDRKTYTISPNLRQEIFVRNMFTDALAVSARSVLVLLHKKGAHLAPSAQDVTLLGLINESSKILQVAVIEVIATNGNILKKWGHEI